MSFTWLEILQRLLIGKALYQTNFENVPPPGSYILKVLLRSRNWLAINFLLLISHSFHIPSAQCNTSMASFLWWYHHIGTDHAQWCATFSYFVLHEVCYPVNLEVQLCFRGCVVSAMFQMAFSKMICWAPCYPAFLCKRGLKETTRVDGLFCKLNCHLWHCVYHVHMYVFQRDTPRRVGIHLF